MYASQRISIVQRFMYANRTEVVIHTSLCTPTKWDTYTKLVTWSWVQMLTRNKGHNLFPPSNLVGVTSSSKLLLKVVTLRFGAVKGDKTQITSQSSIMPK